MEGDGSAGWWVGACVWGVIILALYWLSNLHTTFHSHYHITPALDTCPKWSFLFPNRVLLCEKHAHCSAIVLIEVFIFDNCLLCHHICLKNLPFVIPFLNILWGKIFLVMVGSNWPTPVDPIYYIGFVSFCASVREILTNKSGDRGTLGWNGRSCSDKILTSFYTVLKANSNSKSSCFFIWF